MRHSASRTPCNALYAAIRRFRGNVTFVGRKLQFVLPAELLTEADIALLEGQDLGAQGAPTLGPHLPLSCGVTSDIQRRLVAAATRQLAGSADFLVPWFVAAFLIGVIAFVGSAPVIAGTVVFGVLFVLPGLRGVRRTRQRMRATYAVGLTVRAYVTSDRMLLSLEHATLTVSWADYSLLGIRTDVVLLRRARRRLMADRTLIMPIAWFDPEALATMATAVRGRF